MTRNTLLPVLYALDLKREIKESIGIPTVANKLFNI